MFGLPNLKTLAESELAKIESSLGTAKIAAVKADLAAGFAALEAFEAKFSPADLEAAANLLFPGKLTAAEVASAEAAVAQVVKALQEAVALASELPEVL